MFNMYVHSTMINASHNSDYWKLPPKWAWTRVYSMEAQSGIDIFEQFKWDTAIAKCASNTREHIKITSIDGKLPDYNMHSYIDFELTKGENQFIGDTLAKCFRCTVKHKLAKYKKDEYGHVNGFIVYDMSYSTIELTLHGILTGPGYNKINIRIMYPECSHVLTNIRNSLEK